MKYFGLILKSLIKSSFFQVREVTIGANHSKNENPRFPAMVQGNRTRN